MGGGGGGIKFTKTRKYKDADLDLKGVKHGFQQSLWSWTTDLRPGSSFAGWVTLGNFQIHKIGMIRVKYISNSSED